MVVVWVEEIQNLYALALNFTPEISEYYIVGWLGWKHRIGIEPLGQYLDSRGRSLDEIYPRALDMIVRWFGILGDNRQLTPWGLLVHYTTV